MTGEKVTKVLAGEEELLGIPGETWSPF